MKVNEVPPHLAFQHSALPFPHLLLHLDEFEAIGTNLHTGE